MHLPKDYLQSRAGQADFPPPHQHTTRGMLPGLTEGFASSSSRERDAEHHQQLHARDFSCRHPLLAEIRAATVQDPSNPTLNAEGYDLSLGTTQSDSWSHQLYLQLSRAIWKLNTSHLQRFLVLAIKQVPVRKSPSNRTAPSADSWLQTHFTPVTNHRIV